MEDLGAQVGAQLCTLWSSWASSSQSVWSALLLLLLFPSPLTPPFLSHDHTYPQVPTGPVILHFHSTRISSSPSFLCLGFSRVNSLQCNTRKTGSLTVKVQLDDFPQIEHICITSAQFKKQNLTSTLVAPSRPLLIATPPER